MTKSGMCALIAGCVITGWLLEPALAGKGNKGERGGAAAVLSEVEADDLRFMREEEKLARDVYITLHAEWGATVFDNISRSEQRHMDAVLGLLNKYGLKDPALDPDEFANEDLQQLFDELVKTGRASELDALLVGAKIEEVDMEDIVAAMERTDRRDILNVYGNLLAGSENHLAAFVENIERITGEPYEAQWIPQKDVDAILGR